MSTVTLVILMLTAYTFMFLAYRAVNVQMNAGRFKHARFLTGVYAAGTVTLVATYFHTT